MKRVYAVPGSTFWAFKDDVGGREWLRPIDASFLNRFRVLARYIRGGGGHAEVVLYRVRPGHVFVLGDSHTGADSRSIGEIPVNQLLGRVVELRGQDLHSNAAASEWSYPRTPAHG